MTTLVQTLVQFSRTYLIADAAPLSVQERWRSAFAGLLGMLLLEALLTVLPLAADTRRLLAPAGASAVILFCLPHSPLGQPWSIAGGLMVSALAGIACGHWIQPLWLALPCAVALAIWAMAALRCLHPPGGALAILMASQQAGWGTAATVATNVLGLLLAAMAINNLVGKRQYPQCAAPQAAAKGPRRVATAGITHQDLATALDRVDGYLDITETDLVTVFEHATENALRRHEAQTCGKLMATEVACVEFATELETVWDLFRGGVRTAVPVLDRSRRVIGLVTLEALLRHVPDGNAPMGTRLRQLLQPTPGPNSNKPEVAGQVMTERFTTVQTGDDLARVAALLANGPEQGDIPVVDEQGKFAGLLRPSDVLSALYHRQALQQAQAA